MKRLELTLAFLQLPLDYFLLVLAGASAFALRLTPSARAIRPILFNLSWERFWPTLLMVAGAWIIIFALAGLYSTNPNRKLAQDLAKVIFACSTGFAGITIFVFFTLQKFDSRFLVLAGWILSIIYVCLGRLLMKGLKSLLYKFGVGLRSVVVIGNESIANVIKEKLSNAAGLGYKLAGSYARFSDIDLGSFNFAKIDEIIFTNPKARAAEALEAIDFANTHHIIFKYSADLFDTIASNFALSTVAGIPIVELRRTRLAGWGRIVKRLTDILGSIILLLLFSPIYLLTAIAVAWETGFPIIYRNERVGQRGQKFFTLKFRSMYKELSTGKQFGRSGQIALKKEAELIKNQNAKSGPVYKITNDPRITPVGKFIRRWSLDELPNFWNVLKGEMSLVGPRPHQPREVNQYQNHHQILLAVKPGVTGLAQISGRSDLNFEDEAKLDTFYIENWNPYLDLIILIKTPFAVLNHKGAW